MSSLQLSQRTVRIGIVGTMLAEYQRRNVFPMLRFDQAKELVQNKLLFDVPIEVAHDIISDAARERLQRSRSMKKNYTCLMYALQHQLGLPSDRDRILEETAPKPARRASNVVAFPLKPARAREVSTVEEIAEVLASSMDMESAKAAARDLLDKVRCAYAKLQAERGEPT